VTRIRRPIGVGVVYPENRDRIIEILRQSLIEREGGTRSPTPTGRVVSAILAPHGPLKAVARPAIAVYRGLLEDPVFRSGRVTLVIVGPNHSELGAPVAIYPGGVWVTPLGEARVDDEFASKIARVDKYAVLDEEAHRYEYSIELQLIFLQFLLSGISEVPRFIAIAVSDTANPDVAESLARSIGEAAKKLGRRVMVVATSEFGYYYSREESLKASQLVVKCLRRLDAECFYSAVRQYNTPICAPAAIGVAVIYSKSLGCSTVKTIHVKLTAFRSPRLYTPYISTIITC